MSRSEIDSLVMFQNSQGRHGRGTLVHINRTSALIEVYNPYSILQLSEVIPILVVMRGEREIYKGRAVVSNIVTTGVIIIVTLTLTDTWSDLKGLKPGGVLRIETERFIKDWTEGHAIQPDYQLIVSNIRNFLSELSHWLEEAEIEAGNNNDDKSSQEMVMAFYEEVKPPITHRLTDFFSQFEETAGSINQDNVMRHKAYARRALHPLILCSPFAHRAYMKPLGFAGDYEMVNMMLEQSIYSPPSMYARIIDSYHINASAPTAHRARISMIQDRLVREAERVILEEERMFTVLNVGCGPALEIQRFIKDCPLANQSVIHLIDFNEETIEYAKLKVVEVISASKNKPMTIFLQKSIDELLREAHRQDNTKPKTYDMVYCAGLFDYFSDQLCKRLVELFFSWLRPGGLLCVTNVDPSNPVRFQMEYLLEWNLVYRNETDMKKLAPDNSICSLSKDSTGVNVFLDIRTKI